jgi:hypothetical protein
MGEEEINDDDILLAQFTSLSVEGDILISFTHDTILLYEFIDWT